MRLADMARHGEYVDTGGGVMNLVCETYAPGVTVTVDETDLPAGHLRFAVRHDDAGGTCWCDDGEGVGDAVIVDTGALGADALTMLDAMQGTAVERVAVAHRG